MSIQYCSKNNYIESNRNFLDDYANIESKEIDMTLSGSYLNRYPKFIINKRKFSSYPSKTDATDLINLIKEKNKISNEVVIGAGSNGILQNLIKLFMKPGDNLVTPFYSFNQAEYAVTTLDGITRRVKCDDYRINFDLLKKATDKKTKIIYICNPNNPTGIYVSADDIVIFAKKTKKLVIVDESSIEFSFKKSVLECNDLPDNLIVLRSFSKAYGLANLRIGYMICSSQIKKYYCENTTINEFSGISIMFAKKMIQKYNYVLKNVKKINKEKQKLILELQKLGVELIESDSNTIMTKTTFDKELIKKIFLCNITVIPIYDEYNKIHFRIAVQNKKINKIFVKKLKKVLKK